MLVGLSIAGLRGVLSIHSLRDYTEKSSKSHSSTTLVLLILVLVYALFALDRIKKLSLWSISGIATTNEIWIILLVCLIHAVHSRAETRRPSWSKYSVYAAACLYVILVVMLVGAFNAISFPQYVYAILVFLVPSFLFFVATSLGTAEAVRLSRVLVVLCLVYSVFALILATNYAFFMKLVGNPVDDRYYHQYRARMMLGSNITVSYFLNLALPLCFHLFRSSQDRSWRAIASLAIATNIAATLALLSRNASLVAACIVLFYTFSSTRPQEGLRRRIWVFVLLIAPIYFAVNRYDLSRLLNPLSRSDSSVSERLEALSLGLLIFQQAPFFGSGVGRYFERVYHSRFVTVDGVTGLVDPHNMYVLVLSELGIFGFLALIALFAVLAKSFSNITERSLRQTAYITLFGFLFGAVGGSHLFTEISFATIFWIYMGMFSAMSRGILKS